MLASGLDATVVQPGQIVGKGGLGFDMLAAQAKKRVAMVMGPGRGRLRAIGIDDLVDVMVTILDEPRSFGLRLEVGSDDVLTKDQMIDAIAKVLGRSPPSKVHIPMGVLTAAAVVLGPLARLPKGAVKGILKAMDMDLVGDMAVSRALLPRVPMSFEDAARRALASA